MLRKENGKLTAHLENYDRPTDRPTNQPSNQPKDRPTGDQPTDKQGHIEYYNGHTHTSMRADGGQRNL